jgi:uncharacterized membrane protein
MAKMKSTPMTEEQRLRLAAVLFFLGGACMLIAGLGAQKWLMVVAGVLELVAWFCFVTRANQVEDEASA